MEKLDISRSNKINTMPDIMPYLAYVNESGAFFRSDCFDLLKGIKSNTISLCFTDPPFNLGKVYEDPTFNDNISKDKYFDWCRSWMLELIRVLKPGGSLCTYLLPKTAIELGYWLNQNKDVTYRSLIAMKMKSGFPIRGRIHPALYTILYYTKNGKKPIFNVVRNKAPLCRKCNGEIRDYGGYRKKFKKFEDENGTPWIQISDFWEDTRPARQDKSRKQQINELPLHIPERIILMTTNEETDNIVLDILGGGGSTCHAAQMHGRLWIGCDINDKPALSRFATIWGRTEQETLNPKIEECFDKTFIEHLLTEKKAKGIYPIGDVSKLTNGRSMVKKDVVSKSKVLGF